MVEHEKTQSVVIVYSNQKSNVNAVVVGSSPACTPFMSAVAQLVRAPEIRPSTNVGFPSSIDLWERGFVGVEYFIAPKICIGTEFGWRLMMEQGGKSKTSYEKYDPFAGGGTGAIVAHTETSLGNRTFSSGLDNFNTQVYFHFYF